MAVNELRMNALNVYPNPGNTGIFNLKKTEKWELFAVSGNKVLMGETSVIDISNLSKGIYLLKIEYCFQKLVFE